MKIKKMFLLATCSIGFLFTQSFSTAQASEMIQVENFEQLTEELADTIKDYDTEQVVQYVGDVENIAEEAKKIMPQIVGRHDEIAGILKSYKYQIIYKQNRAQLTYQFTYYTSKEKNQKAEQLLNKVAQQIMKTNKTDYARVKAVNDYIVSNTSYGGRSLERYTVYGLIANRQAVCQGYALATYDLLKRMGIPVRYVVGKSYGQNHSWNKVQISGQWYNLDTTWNDPTPNHPTEVGYNYFLISDRQLEKDHTWNKENYPASTNTKYDFLVDTGSAIQVGDVFYYSNSKDQHRLYMYDLKKAKKTRLTSTRAQYITHAKGKLYFSNYSSGAHLYQMDIKSKKLIRLAARPTKNIQIKGNYIWYQSGTKQYKLKMQ